MSRNFGLGSRDMGTAGQYALNNAAQSGGVFFDSWRTAGASLRGYQQHQAEQAPLDKMCGHQAGPAPYNSAARSTMHR